ncbi:MAG: glycine zipper 2TM domain-containing protein [Proteobacteria bacterium]|nr:glycine zipper 2TM domain-containing protein [Pseudomonadota bacterium]
MKKSLVIKRPANRLSLQITPTKSLVVMLSIASLFGSAYAADLFDNARVISSTPIYERINEPRRDCSTENVQSAPKERSMGGGIVGGIAGGLLGSQVGAGNGRTAATAAGAIAGVLVGDRIANQDQPGSQQIEHCRDIDNYRDVIKGYTVTYRYNGQEATTTMPYQPGDTVKVGISLIQDQTKSSRDQGYRQEDRRYRQGERN